ncbi:KDO2-lipid IV(A) lauroyltransferase [Pedobacter westerhofensis]|uniref:KDO2-lipid IV(A) lauroyltransferase n=1 Tax=Pedobacter westerhofensis TaxID=425512 RepID=A0A521FHW5_9SPHI|nr:lysophospholipid acyltransferase family protein [Pedobacter westerhofensis]SMO95797.1 KDO2-lipid IV(A) lauroyltransferase [Pedobacter westerhofensis]
MLKRIPSYIGLFFIYALSLLPLRVLYLFASLLYLVLYYITGYRRAVVSTNLKKSFPEKSSEEIKLIEKRYYKYLSALIFEIIKMSTISKAQLKRRFIWKNIEQMNAYADQGIGVLACSAHYGNWEWGTLSIGLSFKGNTYPIYKPLSSKAFDQWFNHIRTRFGNQLIAMRQTYRSLAETKNIPSLYLFGNDQAPPKEESHQWITFLNQHTSVQQGMEKIAIKTNRPVFYLKLSVLRKGYYQVECIPICLNPAASSQQEITALHTSLLEEIIRERPEYWLWSHKRWKHQPG